MHILMTKVISISDDAYNDLKKIKEQKSFSEIIVEITRERNRDNILKYAGILDKKTAEKMKKEIYGERKIPSRRFN